MKRVVLIGLIGPALALALATPSLGETVVWTNALSGAWTNAANWNPNRVPGAGDEAVITNAGNYTVSLSRAVAVGSLIFGAPGLFPVLAQGTNPCTLGGNSQIVGGTVSGSTNLTLDAGTLILAGGSLTGSGEILIRSGSALTIGGNLTLSGRTLRNDGTVAWTNGLVNTDSGAVIDNRLGATFTVGFDGSMGGTRHFTNRGTFLKAAGSGLLTVSDQFHNQGLVEVQSGTLSLTGGGIHTGTFAIASNAFLRLVAVAPTTHLLSSNSVVGGDGNLRISGVGGNNVVVIDGRIDLGGSTTFAAGTTVECTNTTTRLDRLGTAVTLSGGRVNIRTGRTVPLGDFSFTGGYLDSSDPLTIANRLLWTTATNLGPGTITIAGSLSINNTVGLLGGTINHQGSAIWSAGQINTASGAVINNLPGATFEARSGANSLGWSGPGLFNNDGAFTKTGTGTCVLGNALTNSGTLGVLSGTLAVVNDYVQTAGSTTLSGGTLVATTTRIQAGRLSGRGTIAGNLAVAGGQLELGNVTGPLAVTGQFTSDSASTLTMDFAGLVNGGNYLAVVGSSELAGALTVALSSNYRVPANATIPLITSQPTVGGYAPISYPSNLVGLAFEIDPGTSHYVCRVVNTIPEIAAVTNRTILEGVLHTLDLSVTNRDNDPAAGFLHYQTNALPPGATFVSGVSNRVAWIPSETQGPGSYPVTVWVWDDGTPSLSNSVSFTIQVLEVNQAPVIDPIGDFTMDEGTTNTFTVFATDADRPTNTVVFSLEGDAFGATLETGQRVADGRFAAAFRWNPNMAQGGQIYTFTVLAVDTNPDDPGRLHLTNRQTFRVTVNNVNVPPVFAPIAAQTVIESNQFLLRITATDTNVPPNDTIFEILSRPPNLTTNVIQGGPTNRTDLVWTPTEAEGPSVSNVVVRAVGAPGYATTNTFTVTVLETNIPAAWTAPITIVLPEDRSTNVDLAVFVYDPDIPTNALSFSAIGSWPTFVSVSTAGRLTVAPTEANGPGLFNLQVGVNDGKATSTNALSLTIEEVNRPPIITQGDVVFITSQLNQTNVTASDPDLPVNPLTYQLLSVVSREVAPVDVTASITLNPTTGLLSWTPTASQSAKYYDATVRVSDTNSADLLQPTLSDTRTFTIAVKSNNVPPRVVLSTNGVDFFTNAATSAVAVTNRIAERVLHRLHIAVTDVDFPTNQLTLVVSNAPPGMCLTNLAITSLCAPDLSQTNVGGINAADPGGTLSTLEADLLWSPTEAQGPLTNRMALQVTDGGGLVSWTFVELIVTEVNNAAPVWVFPPTNATYTFNQRADNYFPLIATDEDIPSTQSFTVRRTASGDAISQSSILVIAGQPYWRWNPNGAGTRDVTFTVSDGANTSSVDMTALVVNANVGPIFYSPANGFNTNIALGDTVTMSVRAIDPDGGNPTNRNLTYTLLTAALSPTPTFTQNVNVATFTWTPAAVQKTNITVQVRDGNNLTASVTFSVTVRDAAATNTPPILVVNTNLPPIAETREFILPLGVVDPDVTDSMIFSLVSGPAGMILEQLTPRIAQLRWTPTEADGPTNASITISVTDDGSPAESDIVTFAVAVLETNSAPVFTLPMTNRNVFAVCVGETREITTVAEDADSSGDRISFDLAPGAPPGAVLLNQTNAGPASATIAFTPVLADLGSTFEIRVIATDTNVADAFQPNLSVTNSLFFVVIATNSAAPEFALTTNRIDFTELTANSFTIPMTDADPTNVLTFELVSSPIPGLTLHPRTGVLTWTPTEAQGPQLYAIQVQVTDDGCPVRVVTTNLTVAVDEANTAPQFQGTVEGVIFTNAVGAEFLLDFEAFDLDQPAQNLTFALAAGPAGTTLSTNAFAATVRWTPTASQVGAHTMTITVTDDGPGLLSAAQTFTVIAEGDPYMTALSATNGVVILGISATPGVTYEIECSTNLLGSVWTSVRTNTATLAPAFFTNSIDQAAGFYRVRQR